MGTWGLGPFENDAAADFIEWLRTSLARAVTKALRGLAARPAGELIDIDDSGAGWAACELVALAFGSGDTPALDRSILDIVAGLRPKEELRLVALDALARIADRTGSELAALRLGRQSAVTRRSPSRPTAAAHGSSAPRRAGSWPLRPRR